MPLFFLYLFFFLHYIHSYNHSLIFAEALLHIFIAAGSVGGTSKGVAEPRFELGAALQQVSALLSHTPVPTYLVTHRHLLNVVTHRRLSLINLFSWPTISPLSHPSVYLPTLTHLWLHMATGTLFPLNKDIWDTIPSFYLRRRNPERVQTGPRVRCERGKI